MYLWILYNIVSLKYNKEPVGIRERIIIVGAKAEPYEPERYADKPMIVDVSGLDMFKELPNTLKPANLNTKNFPQYAENDKANVASDAGYYTSYALRYVKYSY